MSGGFKGEALSGVTSGPHAHIEVRKYDNETKIWHNIAYPRKSNEWEGETIDGQIDTSTSEENVEGSERGKRMIREHASEQSQEIIDYMYEKNPDPIMIYSFDVENGGTWDWKKRHNPAANVVGVDWGLCGTNDHWHKHRVQDERFFTDWRWQADQCIEMWKGGTKFYGKNHHQKVIHKFTIQ